MSWEGAQARPMGNNVRYALISLLGLGKAQNLNLETEDLIRDLWKRVLAGWKQIEHSAGDLGLALWAQAVTGSQLRLSTSQVLQTFQDRRKSLDSVDLAWVMLGADHVLLGQNDASAVQLAELARCDLLKLCNPATQLLYRHARAGILADVSRQVPCFANQIYPVMALAVHARRTGCKDAQRVGRAVAENLCRLQGPLGQWWWLYDARGGAVVDGYPVFSVHQDGMAPMALLETTLSGGRTFHAEIARGLNWIFGQNELEENMVLRSEGLILRDIHKRGVGRLRRAMHSAVWCWGIGNKLAVGTKPTQFTVNRECRPYHLGWVMYAASLMKSAASTTTARHAGLVPSAVL